MNLTLDWPLWDVTILIHLDDCLRRTRDHRGRHGHATDPQRRRPAACPLEIVLQILGAFLGAWGSTIRQKAARHCEAPYCMDRDMSLVYTRTRHGLFEQSITHVRCGKFSSPTSSLCSTFLNCCVFHFDLPLWPILTPLFLTVVLVQTNRDEITWLASQLPPLSCYCTDHSQSVFIFH